MPQLWKGRRVGFIFILIFFPCFFPQPLSAKHKASTQIPGRKQSPVLLPQPGSRQTIIPSFFTPHTGTWGLGKEVQALQTHLSSLGWAQKFIFGSRG